MSKTLRQLLLGVLGLLMVNEALGQGRLFRYTNDAGITVVASSIPPRFVNKGYEVLNSNGQVIKVVDPAPTAEDLVQAQQRQALLEEYELLARRYSSVGDIIAARDRRLAHVDANIAILRANISNLKNQIEELMRRAANAERSGRSVPQHLLNNLSKIRSELNTTENMLRMRQEESQEIHEKFAEDVALFEKGRALAESRESDSEQIAN